MNKYLVRSTNPKVIESPEVIEADFYSVAANGTAHFYVGEPAGNNLSPVASVSPPFIVRKQSDGGSADTGWYKDGGFPPGTFDIPEPQAKALRA